MKFRTTQGRVKLSGGAGHIHTLGEEWTELHERFHKEARAAGCLSEDMVAAIKALEMPKTEPTKGPEENRLERVKAAIRTMLEGNNAGDFNATGTPDLRRLRDVADFNVTSDERDAAWDALSKEL